MFDLKNQLCITISALALAGTAVAGPGPDNERATPESFVDALNAAFGKPTTNRSTHAKGIVLLGKFTPSAQAPGLSRAPHFTHGVGITVRFSDNTGIPTLPDTSSSAHPHGMAIKFHLPDGTETDLVAHSFNGFVGATADEVRQFFLAVGASANAPAPTPLDKFQDTHPAAKRFLTSQDPPAVSFATMTYFGVNTFKFTTEAGKVTFGRYQLRPAAGRHFLTKAEVAKASNDYLFDELRQRIAKGSLRYQLVLQLATPKDKLDDPSTPWADTNTIVELGTVEVSSLVADQDATGRALLFLPAVVPAGIDPADPMINFRNKTYPVSYDRRHRE